MKEKKDRVDDALHAARCGGRGYCARRRCSSDSRAESD